MAMKGQRFQIDLDSDGEPYRSAQPAAWNLALVGDIKERMSFSDPRPPSPPRSKSSQTGFPAHKTRTGSPKFKQGRDNDSGGTSPLDQHKYGNGDRSIPPTNRNENGTITRGKDHGIDQENRQRIAQMSENEIEEARRELISGLSPSLIKKLLKKADIDEDQVNMSNESNAIHTGDLSSLRTSSKKVTFDEPEPTSTATPHGDDRLPSFDPDAPPSHPPPDLQPASQMPIPPPPNMHFPNPPKAPDLDPSDPNFLAALHSTYFPSLPADPSAMAWMAPIDLESEKDSAYSASQDAFVPSALRFDFRGHLLPPRLSSQIPVTKGLHHHAHAPSSAGYTIPELVHLGRSTYPAQRCIAYQTLGRVLYRLGRGYFGLDEDVLCEGLWRLMDQGRVIEGLTEAAAKEDQGYRSVWVTATEAVWLWRKGGGRRWRGR